MWLKTAVQEDDGKGGKTLAKLTKLTKPTAGTPQGGVISPLLANIYLHELDRAWNAPNGPRARWNARLVRYADDFVVLARYIGEPIQQYLTEMLEGRLGLTLNRDKTRIVYLRQEAEEGKEKESLDFLGYTFRYDRSLQPSGGKYLNIQPSAKALQSMRDKLRELTSSRNKRPLKWVIADVNRLLRGWGNYFRYGYPRQAFRDVNRYVVIRMACHLRRRSQRRCRQLDVKDLSLYASLARAGMRYL